MFFQYIICLTPYPSDRTDEPLKAIWWITGPITHSLIPVNHSNSLGLYRCRSLANKTEPLMVGGRRCDWVVRALTTGAESSGINSQKLSPFIQQGINTLLPSELWKIKVVRKRSRSTPAQLHHCRYALGLNSYFSAQSQQALPLFLIEYYRYIWYAPCVRCVFLSIFFVVHRRRLAILLRGPT